MIVNPSPMAQYGVAWPGSTLPYPGMYGYGAWHTPSWGNTASTYYPSGGWDSYGYGYASPYNAYYSANVPPPQASATKTETKKSYPTIQSFLDLLEAPEPQKEKKYLIDPDAPNPMTKSFLRYLGYTNEFGEAFHEPLKMVLGAISPKWGKLADKIVKATYDVVFAYMVVDASAVGVKEYYYHRERGEDNKYARALGVQAGIGQALFQFLASYRLPADAIRLLINPAGQKFAKWAIYNQILPAGKNPKNLGALQRFVAKHAKHLTMYSGTLLSLAAIPLLVKIIDPLAHAVVKNLWLKPTERIIDDRYGKNPFHLLHPNEWFKIIGRFPEGRFAALKHKQAQPPAKPFSQTP